MARFAVSLKVDARTVGAEQFSAAGGIVDPINASGTAADTTAVDNAVGVLVADAASPTQGHVDTLSAAWTALKADIAAVPATADVVLSVNATNVVTKTVLRRALSQLMRLIEGGSGGLTP